MYFNKSVQLFIDSQTTHCVNSLIFFATGQINYSHQKSADGQVLMRLCGLSLILTSRLSLRDRRWLGRVVRRMPLIETRMPRSPWRQNTSQDRSIGLNRCKDKFASNTSSSSPSFYECRMKCFLSNLPSLKINLNDQFFSGTSLVKIYQEGQKRP